LFGQVFNLMPGNIRIAKADAADLPPAVSTAFPASGVVREALTIGQVLEKPWNYSALANLVAPTSNSTARLKDRLDSGTVVFRKTRMSHPDPDGPADCTPIQVGEIWENPVTRERATIVELPYKNREGRATAELTALVGARVMGEHRHPALVERFTVLEGELTVKLAGQTSVLREGKTAVVDPGVWHDWWNASDRQDARVRVEVTPGERFAPT
jgi:quercetin dioxygenase-like cupin family protein